MAVPAPALSDNSDCVLTESAEVGTVPLGEEAAIQSEAGVTSPAVGASSDCVLADLAEGETKQLGDLVNSESVFEAEASPVSERGLATRGQRDSTARSGGRPRPRASLTTVTASSPSLPRSGQFRLRRRPCL